MQPPPQPKYSIIPSVDALLREPVIQQASTLAPAILTRFLRSSLTSWREAIKHGELVDRPAIIARIAAELTGIERPRAIPLINGTGILIHTNLGRAPVSEETAAAMAEAAANPVALEVDPATNQRGGRGADVSRLMSLLTGAESTLVVNNNAAAITLTLAALANKHEVILSRGEAVEIGGGFRIPDVMRESGAILVEVGTTNRTYPRDYADAISTQTAALLKVHSSNFQISGFTRTTSAAELTDVAKNHHLLVIEDQGSGALINPDAFGLGHESTVGDSIAAGVDVVTVSGDKLVGGPQAGLIVGRSDVVEKIRLHPLARAVRADKVCLAGIAATLRHYARGEANEKIPVWQMIAAQPDALYARAIHIAERLGAQSMPVSVRSTTATTGGGSLPGQMLPSFGIAISGEAVNSDVNDIASRLRTGQPAVWGRIHDDTLIIDVRSVPPERDQDLIDALIAARR